MMYLQQKKLTLSNNNYNVHNNTIELNNLF